MQKKINWNIHPTETAGKLRRYTVCIIIAVVLVLIFIAFIFLLKSPTSKDVWDRVDILAKVIIGIAGVLIPGIIAWGIHVYNKRQHQLELNRQENELRIRQLDVVHQFLPELRSGDLDVQWTTLALIGNLGGKELAEKIADASMKVYWEQENREVIERYRKDRNPGIADLATRSFRRISSQSKEGIRHKRIILDPEYILKTSEIISQTDQVIFKDNENERYGDWVVSRGQHGLMLPEKFRMGTYLVTNECFLEFIKDNGYENETYWSEAVPGICERCLSEDGRTGGPSTWKSGKEFKPEMIHHPVSGIGYYEAIAFCNWLQCKYPPSEQGWKWKLPTEDMWEYSARTDEGLSYPWGSDFKSSYCNWSESGYGTTTAVNTYHDGKSRYGCYDMAGNVWEFVVTDDQEHGKCVLKGGSFHNDKHLLKTYLRLFGVPRDHRPTDFGFRCCQIYEPYIA